jgi:hypothetical protein
MEETDQHLFFTCTFARVAWFNNPWNIRTDTLILNANSLTDVFLNLINMNHPHATLTNVLTFMWCLWKSRNDNRFNKKQGHPSQIQYMAAALQQNMKMLDVLQDNRFKNMEHNREVQMQGEKMSQSHKQNQLPPQGHTIKTDLKITGSKLYTDAAWKTKKAPGLASVTATGIGVYCEIKQFGSASTVMIQASILASSSVL